MKFKIRIVQPSSSLRDAAATQFLLEIKQAIGSGVEVVLVDLQNVTSLASAELIVLVEGLKLIQNSHCRLFICSLSDQLKIVFELTGLDQVFELLSDPQEVSQFLQPTPRVEPLKTAVTTLERMQLAS